MPDNMDMPAFKDESDPRFTWIWDSQAHTYIRVPSDQVQPDRGHASGGDNNLFDPAQRDGNLFHPKNPDLEGVLASTHESVSWSPNTCPRCSRDLDHLGFCESCGWSPSNVGEIDWRNPPAQPTHVDPFPERTPKPNPMKTDPSFPSMTGKTAADEWDDVFFGAEVNEIGKFVIDMDGHMHYEPGAHADHDRIMQRDHVNQPGCLGSVYSDGTAQIQRVYPGFQPQTEMIQQQLGQAFGEGITITHVAGGTPEQQQEPTFAPFVVPGVFLGGRASGPAWVMERSDGHAMQQGMILVAEHLRPEDYPLYQLAAGVVTATGGMNSHAAIVARQSGIPTVIGIGAEYNKIATGNLLTIDEKGVTVAPDAAALAQHQAEQARQYQMEPLQADPYNGLHEYMRRRLTPLSKKEFAHAAEEMAFLANQPMLENCPQCNDVMMPGQNEAVCHSCGHRQPVITTQLPTPVAGVHVAFLPALAGMLAGRAALPLVGRLMSGAMGRAAVAGGVSGLIQNHQPNGTVPSGPNVQPVNVGPTAIVTHALDDYFIFEAADDDDEVGGAVKDRGDDEVPGEDTQGFNEEHGDSPELLKDVNDIGGPKDANPHNEDDAFKALHANLPLVVEFAESDKSGEDHPILKALDELLEAVFPGYRLEDVEHHPADMPAGHAEEPSEATEHEDEGSESDGADEDDSDDKKESNFHEGSFHDDEVPMEHLSWTQGDDPLGVPQQDSQLPGAVPGAVPPVGAGGVGQQPCPNCGYPHDPSVPCQNQNQVQPQMPMQQVPMQPMASVWRVVGGDDKPSDGAGDTGDKEHGEHEHPGHDWVDTSGQPLMEGQQYELVSPQYTIPDKVTVDRLLPDKLVFTVHTDLMDYQDEMSKDDLVNEGYTFSPVEQTPDSTDGFDAEAPVRPGDDALPQQDDLSQQSTVVSHDHGIPELAWLKDDHDPVHAASTPVGLEGIEVGKQSRRLPDARYAGKDYSPREQREFIDEPGRARNYGELDLAGTHYEYEPATVEDSFLW